jgi:hypothetical protein
MERADRSLRRRAGTFEIALLCRHLGSLAELRREQELEHEP